MVVISYAVLREFIGKNPQSADVLNNWYRAAEKGDWGNYHEMKSLFSNSVDAQLGMIVLYLMWVATTIELLR